MGLSCFPFRKRVQLASLVLGSTFWLHGCSWNAPEVYETPSNTVSRDNQSRDNALVNLTLEPVDVEVSSLQALTLPELREQYQSLMPKVDELSASQDTELAWQEGLGHQIRNRLADIEMLLAEQAQADGTQAPNDGYYALAIDAYTELLDQAEQQPSVLTPLARENILYQLARAHSLQGDEDQAMLYAQQLLRYFPDTLFASELYFRQGEQHYNNGDYTAAIEAYQRVLVDQRAQRLGFLKRQTSDPFYPMSAYMKAWSHFKLDQEFKALDAFTLMLAATLIPENASRAHRPLDDLGLSERKLVDDAMAMMALIFTRQGGARAIVDHFYYSGEQPFTYLVFDHLAQGYLNDSNYRDSADVWLSFAISYPQHDFAIEAFIKHIDAYIIGDFPSDVLPAKQRFVEAYGIESVLWQGFTAAQSQQAMPYLDQYLQELAQFEHALAQQTQALLRQTDDLDDVQIEQLKATQQKAFSAAQRWYKEYIATFGTAEKVADIQFYLAESYYQNEQYVEAVTEYQTFAYQYPQHEQAANAAYTALLALQTLQDTTLASGLSTLQTSQIEFLNRFAQDPRANAVATTLTQDLFDQERYIEAIDWAGWLLARPLPAETVKVARLVLAQSQFEIRDYAAAQINYQQLLAGLEDSDSLAVELNDKLAATYFQQAQQLLTAANASQVTDVQRAEKLTASQASALRAAVERLQQVMLQTPDSPIAISAQYDAANYLMQLSDWSAAIALLVDFEQRYPTHELTETIPDKLIVAYEKTGDWLPASELLAYIWQANQATDLGREALYLSAQYADRAGEREVALPRFRTYAHTYPQPLAEANEARYRMSQFYVDSNEPAKRRFWLNKMIQADASAGKSRSDRSRFLAAMSQTVFADDAFYIYEQIALTLPLDKSIQRKREALQRVVDINQQILSYQIAEFSTKAGHRLGQVYGLLANALYASERPQELDALALEQYEILLEEQAYPFEEQAIEVYQRNTKRSWQGIYDAWVAQSFAALAELLPAQYDKQEQSSEVDYAAF